jgi:hypothetical protein
MSRTDSHRPFWVIQKDKYERHNFRPWHHHWETSDWDKEQNTYLRKVSVSCDLSTFIESPATETHCTLFPIKNLCGCRMCTGHEYRKQEIRSARTAWRNTRAKLMRDPEADDSVKFKQRW